MTRDAPDAGTENGSDTSLDRPPRAAMLEALSVRRNALAGAVVGVTLAVGLYLVRVLELLGPFRGTRQFPVLGPEGYYVLLAFVLASATAFLVGTGLTVVTAIRLARREV